MKKIIWLTAALLIILNTLNFSTSYAVTGNDKCKYDSKKIIETPDKLIQEKNINQNPMPDNEIKSLKDPPVPTEVLKIHTLGSWYNPLYINYEALNKDGITAELSESKKGSSLYDVVKINLPPDKVNTVTPFEGSYEWYSGGGNNRENTLRAEVKLPKSDSILLDYMINYSTEEDCDYGFVEVSTNSGKTWDRLKSYDGTSNGWVNEILDLSSYSGKNIILQFKYYTDGDNYKEGIFLDRIRLTAGNETLLSDGSEDSTSPFSANGWVRYQGFNYESSYYIIEWSGNKVKNTNIEDEKSLNITSGLKIFRVKENLGQYPVIEQVPIKYDDLFKNEDIPSGPLICPNTILHPFETYSSLAVSTLRGIKNLGLKGNNSQLSCSLPPGIKIKIIEKAEDMKTAKILICK